MNYDEAIKKSWYIDDVEDVLKTMQSLKALPPGLEGIFNYYDSNGDRIAEFWWNGEADQWMVAMNVERS
jgi:hypothetical protein